jgi:hypothetical protein
MWLGEAESELSELMFFRGFHGEKNVFFFIIKDIFGCYKNEWWLRIVDGVVDFWQY